MEAACELHNLSGHKSQFAIFLESACNSEHVKPKFGS